MKDLCCFVGLCGNDHKKLQYVEPPVVLPTLFHTLQPLHPALIPYQNALEIHLMNPGNKPFCIQDQRSVHLLDRVDIQRIAGPSSRAV